MPDTVLTLLTKPGCHLCDVAREVVENVVFEVCAERATDAAEPSLTVTELSILDDPALADLYAEQIPVVLIDGVVHSIWRVDSARLRAALAIRPSTPQESTC